MAGNRISVYPFFEILEAVSVRRSHMGYMSPRSIGHYYALSDIDWLAGQPVYAFYA